MKILPEKISDAIWLYFHIREKKTLLHSLYTVMIRGRTFELDPDFLQEASEQAFYLHQHIERIEESLGKKSRLIHFLMKRFTAEKKKRKFLWNRS